MFQFRVVPAPVAGGEAMLMHAGTTGTLQTTGFGGGFGEAKGTAQADTGRSVGRSTGGDDFDDDDYYGDDGGGGGGVSGGELRRWGESIVLPRTGLVKPAWTAERYSKTTPGAAATAPATGRRSSGGLAGGAYRSTRS